MLAYDRAGDGHFDTVSAFIKSIRGNDPDAALYWLAAMIAAGEDPRFIARRLIISASEDVGLADPRALEIAVAAAAALDWVGLPEAQYNLAEATAYLAAAPKSNRAGRAYFAAMADVLELGSLPVPKHLRSSGPGRVTSATRTITRATTWHSSICRTSCASAATTFPATRAWRSASANGWSDYARLARSGHAQAARRGTPQVDPMATGSEGMRRGQADRRELADDQRREAGGTGSAAHKGPNPAPDAASGRPPAPEGTLPVRLPRTSGELPHLRYCDLTRPDPSLRWGSLGRSDRTLRNPRASTLLDLMRDQGHRQLGMQRIETSGMVRPLQIPAGQPNTPMRSSSRTGERHVTSARCCSRWCELSVSGTHERCEDRRPKTGVPPAAAF